MRSSGCSAVTDHGVTAVVGRCAQLNVLWADGTGITDLTLETMTRNDKCLEELRISSCPGVGAGGVSTLLEGRGSQALRALHIGNNPKLGADTVKRLAQKRVVWGWSPHRRGVDGPALRELCI